MTSSFQSRLGTAPEEGVKAPCKARGNVDLTLSGEQTVNGTSVAAGDRVFVTAQTDGEENGIYIVQTGSWVRAPDWDGAGDVVNGMLVPVTAETRLYMVTCDASFTVGEDTFTVSHEISLGPVTYSTFAERWATHTGSTVKDPTDDDSDTGEYSSKEYAQGTTASGGTAKEWAQKTSAAVTGSMYAAKEWSIGVLTRRQAGGGSSKDWATRTGATVDDTEYGAKEYAQGDMTATGGSAKAWAQDSASPDGTSTQSAKSWSATAESWASRVQIKEIGTTTHTLTDADGGHVLVFTHASGCTVTLPEQNTEALSAGFECGLRQDAGQVSLATEGSDTLVNSLDQTTLGGDGALAYLYLETAGSPNTWVLSGDTEDADLISNEGTTLPAILSGTLASRPSAGTAGRWYYATAQSRWYRDDGSDWITKGGHLERCLFSESSNQSIPNDTGTALTWSFTVYNVGGFTLSSTDVTLPRDGTVVIVATARFDTNSTGDRQLYSLVDGAGQPGSGRIITRAAANHLTFMAIQSAPTVVSQGQVVTVEAEQDSGGSLDVTATEISIYYIE